MRSVTLALSLGLLVSMLGCGDDAQQAPQPTCPAGQTFDGTVCSTCPTGQSLCNGVCAVTGSCQSTSPCAVGSVVCNGVCTPGACPVTGTGGSPVGHTTSPGKTSTTPVTSTTPGTSKPPTGAGGATTTPPTSTSTGGTSSVVTTKPPATGGSAPTTTTSAPYVDPNPESCTDTSTQSSKMTLQYQKLPNVTTNVPGKTYGIGTNWWGKFDGQTVTVSGLGFTVGNPKNVNVGSSGDPAGFPSILIGQYQNFKTKGSNLPMRVSAIKSVPVVFETNIGTPGDANASFDVWFNETAEPLPSDATAPTAGFVMVWMHKPSNRQPRGGIRASNVTVPGVTGSWNVWSDGTCVSYVHATGINGLTFDLNKFIQHTVTNGYAGKITGNAYLNTIFGGFEIWGGGDGLQLKKFCAKVN